MPRSKVELFAATRQGSPFLGVALTAEQAAWVRAAAWRSFHRKTYMLRMMEARRTKALQQDTARALNEGRREVIKGGVVRDDQFQRACQAVRRKLDRAGGWVPGKVARDAISSDSRDLFDDVIEHLEMGRRDRSRDGRIPRPRRRQSATQKGCPVSRPRDAETRKTSAPQLKIAHSQSR